MITYFTSTTSHLTLPGDCILESSQFSDGAYDLHLPDEVRNCTVQLIHNTRTHDDWIFLYLVIDRLAQRQCSTILTLPYLSYGRQLPDYLSTLLRPLQGTTVLKILTFDLHQEHPGVINVPLASLVAEDIKERGLQDAILVAPDRGSIQRVERLAKLTGQQMIGLKKSRSPGQVTISSRTALPPGRAAIIVDDMVDTGSTLQACVQYLLDQGLPSVHVVATHGVLSFGIGAWADQLASLTFLNTLPPVDSSTSARWLNIRECLTDAGQF